MKQTFEIPEGCKVVTVEQIGNQLITSFEPEKYVPKVGDCVKMQYKDSDFPSFCLIDKVLGRNIFAKNVFIGETEDEEQEQEQDKQDMKFEDSHFVFYSSIEKITPEEFQAEFEKLGYVYDFETRTAHKKRWRAEDGADYYYIEGTFEVEATKDIRHRINDAHYKAGNYFKNEKDAEDYRDYMLQHSLNYNKK